MYSNALRKVAAPLWTNIIHQHSCHLLPAPLWLAHWYFVLCVVDRNGALDLQVQSRGHGGLFTADLWPWPERTYRRRQVTHIQHCYFSHSLSFVLCLCCLCFCCLSFLFFFLQRLLVRCMSNDQFLHRCLQKKNGFGDCFQVHCLCRAQPIVCVFAYMCTCIAYVVRT